MRRCPNQRKRRCHRRDDAVGFFVRSCFGCWYAVARTQHTQEAPLVSHVGQAYVSAAAIGEGGGPCFRAIKQNGGSQGVIYVNLVYFYADELFAEKWL